MPEKTVQEVEAAGGFGTRVDLSPRGGVQVKDELDAANQPAVVVPETPDSEG